SSILVGGAVLRVAGGVFCGLGDPPREDPQMAEATAEETSETEQGKTRTPLTMIIPAGLLAVGAIVIGVLPHLGEAAQAGAERFQDQAAYAAAVLRTHPPLPPAVFPPEDAAVTAADYLGG